MQRDLSAHDVWEESLRRSRERRERAAAQRQRIELPARGVSLAAAIALSGGTAATAAGGDGWDAELSAVFGAKSGVSPATEAVWAPARAVSAGDPRPADPPRKRASAQSSTSSGTSTSSTTTATEQPDAPAVAVIEKQSQSDQPSAAVATAAGPEPAATTATASRRGGGVKDLQRALGVSADGDFGPGTERALKRWQRRHGLAADGVAGPQTRKALGLGAGAVLKRERLRSRGRRGGAARRSARGGGVAALQRALGVSADGVFGPGTESALKSWQRDHGLAADGVAGPQTRRALGLGPGRLLRRKGGGGSGGGGGSTVARVIAAANAIATKPYEYGGGHGSFTDSGYDCSGSVSYALHGGGLLSQPLDSGGFMSYGRPGPGRHITIYANPGHVYMTIDGRRFDTSARSETGSRWTSTPRSTSGYVIRHPAGL